MNKQNNKDIREAVTNSQVYYYEIADYLGISTVTLRTWMHKELSEVQKEIILDAVKDIVSER